MGVWAKVAKQPAAIYLNKSNDINSIKMKRKLCMLWKMMRIHWPNNHFEGYFLIHRENISDFTVYLVVKAQYGIAFCCSLLPVCDESGVKLFIQFDMDLEWCESKTNFSLSVSKWKVCQYKTIQICYFHRNFVVTFVAFECRWFRSKPKMQSLNNICWSLFCE